jgi:hypothetical protein
LPSQNRRNVGIRVAREPRAFLPRTRALMFFRNGTPPVTTRRACCDSAPQLRVQAPRRPQPDREIARNAASGSSS